MNDADTIRQILAEWGAAFCGKDIDRMMALYAPDAVIFDAIPPFRSDLMTLRTKVIDCFPYMPDVFNIETTDVGTEVGGDLAVAHGLWHFTGLPPGHPAGRLWLRSTLVLRRQRDGSWRIIHDHCSAPFDPVSERIVADPALATSALSQRNPAGWFEIYVDDMARAKAFYSAMLDVTLSPLHSPIELWAFPSQPNAPGAGGALARIAGCVPKGNGTLVYFSCADCGETAAKAVAAGGQIHKAKMSIGEYGFIALVTDTEGNLIGLHSMH